MSFWISSGGVGGGAVGGLGWLRLELDKQHNDFYYGFGSFLILGGLVLAWWGRGDQLFERS